jgi:hypothetical protein
VSHLIAAVPREFGLDHAELQAAFRDGSASALGSVAIGPVTNTDRGSLTRLLRRAAEGGVRMGTRSIQVRFLCTRFDDSYNDGYADSLTLVLTPSTVGVEGPWIGGLEFPPVWPNPTRASVRLAFHLPQATNVTLTVHDARGRRVAVVATGAFRAGDLAFIWRCPSEVRSGVYFARLQAGSQVSHRHLVLID